MDYFPSRIHKRICLSCRRGGFLQPVKSSESYPSLVRLFPLVDTVVGNRQGGITHNAAFMHEQLFLFRNGRVLLNTSEIVLHIDSCVVVFVFFL